MAPLEADYIIVGGGLTGCALASRLLQGNPALNILVLEAGIDASDNPLTRDFGGAFALAGSPLDYNYKSTPQPNTGDRVHTITAGKVVGGGSILNYGAWARGDASDYDHWARTVEDERWSYAAVLPYLKRPENHFEAKENPEQRGSDGPIRVTSVLKSDPKRRYGLREPIKAAWEELGLKHNPRGDCGSLAGICDCLENWKDGQRQPSNLAHNLNGVDIVTSAVVHKVVLTKEDDGPPTASSVLLVDGRQFKARKEIVLSAGTVKTPQILMLSGIGPADLLSKYDVSVVYDNLEVGKNYFAFYKGLPCDWAVNEGVPPQSLEPALQADVAGGKMSDQSLLDPTRCLVETMVLYSPVGAPAPVNGSYLATSVMLLVPTSRGSVKIISASPTDDPAIDPNFYDTEVDRTALIYGTRRVIKALLGTSAGRSYIECEEAPPGIPALKVESSDADIDARIRMAGMSHAHSAGTAAMGKVVDSQLRVKGVKGLRIADASVFPVAIGGHPQATLYGIAEKASDLILQDIR
ncbi:MAG: hypothetical protein Q9217_001435 [Psora testacea]